MKTKTPLRCFTVHVRNLKYMKVSLFEISYKKKKTFSPYSNVLRCICRLEGFFAEEFEKSLNAFIVVIIIF